MKFFKNVIILSVVSFAFVTFNIGAATEAYADFRFGGLSGYTSEAKTKYLTSTTQKMETLRADHRIIATLYGVVLGSGVEKVKTIYIEKKENKEDIPEFIQQSFGSGSTLFQDYKLNLKKDSIFGNTRYWGTWIYDFF